MCARRGRHESERARVGRGQDAQRSQGAERGVPADAGTLRGGAPDLSYRCLSRARPHRPERRGSCLRRQRSSGRPCARRGGLRRVVPGGWPIARRRPCDGRGPQMDIGFGDALALPAEETDYPVLLDDLPAPRIRAYPREASIAEKFHAMVSLDVQNSRMKDFHDIWAPVPSRSRARNCARRSPRASSAGGRPGRRRCRAC